MISLKYDFLFVHIPKTAGNSIQNILRNYSEDRIVCSAPFQDGIERFGVMSERYNTHKHSTLLDYKARLGNEIFQRIFKFTCVRNPWDRMVSCYFSPHLGPRAWNRDRFLGLISEIEPASWYLSLEHEEITGIDSFKNIDYFIRFENLDDDFRHVCHKVGIPWEPIPKRNKSERRWYVKYYDDELEGLVRSRFSDEIEFFGYEFNSTS